MLLAALGVAVGVGVGADDGVGLAVGGREGRGELPDVGDTRVGAVGLAVRGLEDVAGRLVAGLRVRVAPETALAGRTTKYTATTATKAAASTAVERRIRRRSFSRITARSATAPPC